MTKGESEPCTTIGANLARLRFSELLDRVEPGEVVAVARHGVPVHRRRTSEQQRDAIEAVRKLTSGNSLRGVKVKDLIAKGRR